MRLETGDWKISDGEDRLRQESEAKKVKVLVEGKGFINPAILHQRKTNCINKTEVLVFEIAQNFFRQVF